MTPSPKYRTTAIVAAVAAAVGLAGLHQPQLHAEDSTAAAGLIQRVVRQATRSGVAVRAVRELHAGTRTGKHQGRMEVETVLTPSGRFSWTVLEESGSERTRQKVFREVLKAEGQSWQAGARDAAALTPENYAFTVLDRTPGGHTRIRLEPRRSDSRLVDGTLTVSADGYPIRLEGSLAKSPSFWVKSVTIVKRFGRFDGIALPTTIESHADLRMFGQSSFTMRYHYREVNGVPVAGSQVADAGDR